MLSNIALIASTVIENKWGILSNNRSRNPYSSNSVTSDDVNNHRPYFLIIEPKLNT